MPGIQVLSTGYTMQTSKNCQRGQQHSFQAIKSKLTLSKITQPLGMFKCAFLTHFAVLCLTEADPLNNKTCPFATPQAVKCTQIESPSGVWNDREWWVLSTSQSGRGV
mmetsp:Transcript_74463/g.131583  ORF Transcript_74463/g.131583 Transcript_74463/m.131583 type:complete len:108 (-) Transcript_74463:179-502(-)